MHPIDRRAMLAVAAMQRDAGGGVVTGHGPVGIPLPDDALAAAVAALPEVQREVVALKIDAGLTFAEIAAVTGTSLNTAASRYRYALEKLRTVLRDDDEETP